MELKFTTFNSKFNRKIYRQWILLRIFSKIMCNLSNFIRRKLPKRHKLRPKNAPLEPKSLNNWAYKIHNWKRLSRLEHLNSRKGNSKSQFPLLKLNLLQRNLRNSSLFWRSKRAYPSPLRPSNRRLWPFRVKLERKSPKFIHRRLH